MPGHVLAGGEVVHAHPGRVLAGASARADLVVLGADSEHDTTGAVSVTRAVLNHAPRPRGVCSLPLTGPGGGQDRPGR